MLSRLTLCCKKLTRVNQANSKSPKDLKEVRVTRSGSGRPRLKDITSVKITTDMAYMI